MEQKPRAAYSYLLVAFTIFYPLMQYTSLTQINVFLNVSKPKHNVKLHSTGLVGPLDFQNQPIFMQNFHVTTVKTETQIKNGLHC